MSYQRESGHSHVFFFCCRHSHGFIHRPVSSLLHHLIPLPSSPLISSWTEDTRSRIFSDAALQPGTDGRRPVAAELDMQIEQKFDEFDELVATGQSILGKEHHLTQMVSRVTERRPCGCCPSPLSRHGCVAGEGAHGGAEEHARLDPGALEGSETTVAPSEEQTGARAR